MSKRKRNAGGRPRKVTMERFKRAIVGTFGVKSDIAKRMGVTRQAVYKFCRDNPDAAEMIAQARGELGDLAETAMITRIRDGDGMMIKLALQMTGRFVDSKKIDNTVTVKNPIQIYIPDNGRD